MKYIANALLLTALLSCYHASTAATKEERISQIFQITFDKKSFTPLFSSLLAQPQIKWDEQKRNRVAEQLLDLTFEVFEPKMVEVYARLFTDAEIDELLAFYSSALGKKIIANNPAIAAAVLEATPVLAARAQQIINQEQKNSQPVASTQTAQA